MRATITAGQTSCPFYFSYDGSLGEDPVPLIELSNSDGSFIYDDSVLIERNAAGTIYEIIGEPDDSGKFLYSYRFTLTGAGTTQVVSFSFPLTLPYVLQ